MVHVGKVLFCLAHAPTPLPGVTVCEVVAVLLLFTVVKYVVDAGVGVMVLARPVVGCSESVRSAGCSLRLTE